LAILAQNTAIDEEKKIIFDIVFLRKFLPKIGEIITSTPEDFLRVAKPPTFDSRYGSRWQTSVPFISCREQESDRSRVLRPVF
jgi:hypothetical protein